ncbi:MAG: response regulator [Tepidiformaceae bacterium]
MSEVTTIFLVDDSEPLRKVAARYLSMQPGLEVVGEAADGTEAIEPVLAVAPDVVVIDREMPRLGGIETIRQLRRRGCPARVLLFSADLSREHVRQALAVGANGVLTKGPDPEELASAVREVSLGNQVVRLA